MSEELMNGCMAISLFLCLLFGIADLVTFILDVATGLRSDALDRLAFIFLCLMGVFLAGILVVPCIFFFIEIIKGGLI